MSTVVSLIGALYRIEGGASAEDAGPTLSRDEIEELKRKTREELLQRAKSR